MKGSKSSENVFNSDLISEDSSVKENENRKETPEPQNKLKRALSGFPGKMFGSSRDKDEQSTRAEIWPVRSLVVDCNSQTLKEILAHVNGECLDSKAVSGEYFSKKFEGDIDLLNYSCSKHQIDAEFEFVSSADYSAKFYYTNKHLIFILCDRHQKDSIEKVSKLRLVIEQGYYRSLMPVIILLVVNKNPGLVKVISDQELDKTVNHNKFAQWYEIDTSHFPSLKEALTSCLIHFQKTHEPRKSSEESSEKKKFCSIM
jgi:hypothetical protein